MNSITILLSITIFYTNIYSTLSNYTEFTTSVCNTSYIYYDDCSCELAQFAASHNNLNCFNAFNCPYTAETNVFCSGHGYCNFNNGSCICNDEYGSSDCSEKYELFLPNTAILYLMIVISSILLVLSLLLIIWVHLYRNVGDVKAMSVVFTHLTLVGCALITCGTIVMGIGFSEANCVILEWFHFLGICIVISCALLKSYRIASIFGQSTFSPSDLTDFVLLKYFSIMIVINLFFLIIYTIFNFVEGGSYTRYIIEDVEKENRCSSEPLTMVSYSLLVAWQLVLLLFVIKYGNETRSASKIFKETKCIYIGSNIGSMFFIAFGIFVLFTTNYTLQIVIRGYGSLIVVMMVISLLFYPKFKTVYNLRLIKKNKNKSKQQIIDENGNIINEKEEALKRQYEAHVKDPNGKELLLLLNALVKEIKYRANMKMLSIELNSIHMKNVNDLLINIKELIPKNDMSNENDQKLNDGAIANDENLKVTPMGIDTQTNDEKILKNNNNNSKSDSGNNEQNQTNTVGLDINDDDDDDENYDGMVKILNDL